MRSDIFYPFPARPHKAARSGLLPFLALAALVLAFSCPALANLPMEKFVLIQAGPFLMGTQGQVGDGDPPVVETPQHAVTITRDFYLKKTEVTRGEWMAVMGINNRPWLENGNPKPNVHGVESLEDDNYPATYISYADAVAFCEKLNTMAGGPWFRLPTEAEWEYACRQGGEAGENLLFAPNVTEENLGDYAWFRENSNHDTPPVGMAPHPVGQKEGTSFDDGLFDMHGNVAEWVSDWYNADHNGGGYPDAAQVDPVGPTSGQFRIVRGGNYESEAIVPFGGHDCRCASRRILAPAVFTNFIGFRIVRAVSIPTTGGRFVPAGGGGDGGGGGCYIMDVFNR